MVLIIAAIAAPAAAESPQPPAAPAPAGMQLYDRLVGEWMKKWNVPGGQIAVARGGRLVLVRSYGWANAEARTPVKSDSRFRIASVSKPITAVAILRLVEAGRLDLDATAFELLPQFPLSEAPGGDPRLARITLRQLLTHTAGWDRDKTFDPMFIPFKAAQALRVPPPADAATIIRYMLRQPLDFEPGQKYVYSNFGYCLLGRVIEQATGKSYAEAVRELVLEPCGARSLGLGRTRLSERSPREVRYYAQPASERTRSVFPDAQEQVAEPDGGFYLEALDAHGGWIGTAPDLLRFATSLDGSRQPALLKPETLALMTARPAAPVSQAGTTHYGLGWMIRYPEKDKDADWQQSTWWHTGSLPGTAALLVRTNKGLSWAALFNSRPPYAKLKQFAAELDRLMWKAAEEVKEWPEDDLFEQDK
ncbi:MAG TPA: serine hydrolase domain-containing protein [Pirellulales bacterium]|nr:serine hydrolase domain-containing protein [Pirellulales bacterium]